MSLLNLQLSLETIKSQPSVLEIVLHESIYMYLAKTRRWYPQIRFRKYPNYCKSKRYR